MTDSIPPANAPETPAKAQPGPRKDPHRKAKGTDPFSAGFLALVSLLGMQRQTGPETKSKGGTPGAIPGKTPPGNGSARPAPGRSAPPRGKSGTAAMQPPAAGSARRPDPALPPPETSAPEETGAAAGKARTGKPAGPAAGSGPGEGRRNRPEGAGPLGAHPPSRQGAPAGIPPAKTPPPGKPPAPSPNPDSHRSPRRASASSGNPRPASALAENPPSIGAVPRNRPAPAPTGTAGTGRGPKRPGDLLFAETPLPPQAGKTAPSPFPAETAGSLPPGPQPIDPPDLSSLADRVVARLSPLPDGSHRVELRLVPDHLGTLKIDLRIHHGTLDARLQVESPEARAALIRDEPALRQSLLSGGITLSSYTVSVTAGGGSMDRGAFPKDPGGEPRPGREDGGKRAPVAGGDAGGVSPIDPSPSATHWVA